MALILYSVYSWIKEWQNDGKFIIRLAILPGSRLPIALAKFTTIYIMIFDHLLLQIFIIVLINRLGQQLHFLNQSISWHDYLRQYGDLTALVIPVHFSRFLVNYTAGACFFTHPL